MPWAPDYITVANIKDYLRVDPAFTGDDVTYARWATASSRAIDTRCNRQFGKVAAPVTRVYRTPPAYSPLYGLWLLDIDDLMDTTGLTIDGIAYASSGAVLLPDTAALDGKPWTTLGLLTYPTPPSPGVTITHTLFGPFGWSAVPAQVPAAALLQCSRWNFRRDAPAGVAGSPDQGSEVRLLAKLDPDVATTLIGLSRPRKAG
jgi:hypothetical protein